MYTKHTKAEIDKSRVMTAYFELNKQITQTCSELFELVELS